MNNRIQWIDICKGVGIFLVVLGHTSNVLRPYIYGFHMPLFFFLSGLVIDMKKYSTFKHFLSSRFNSIVIPYVFFFLVTYILWVTIERNMRSFDMEWWRPILGLFYGTRFKDLLLFNPILWFLPCLFVTEIIGYLILRLPPKTAIPLILALVATGFMFRTNLPWGINIAFVAVQFLYFGYSLRKFFVQKTFKLIQNKPVIALIISSALLFCYIFVVGNTDYQINMAQCKYSNIVLFEILSWFGICITVILSISVSTINSTRMNKIIAWGGVNSLAIFALHQPIMRVIRFAIMQILQIDITANVWFSIMACLIDIMILVPFAYLYNKKCVPYLKRLYINNKPATINTLQ